MRILHTADWQIGRQYPRFDTEDGAALFEARFAVVERIARHAAHGAFDAVLVAGDVFDAQTVSDRTIRRMFNAMQDYTGTWIMIPGNHDSALVQSVWTRAARLGVVPGNVRLALTPEPIVESDLKMVVLPAPLTQRHTMADATAWFDHTDAPAEYVRIGLAHGSVQGILAEGIDSPNPIARDRAVRAGLDYLALGDWHGMLRIDDRTWYSGTPETDRFRNNESGRILEVVLDGRGAVPQVTPVRMGQYVWESWQVSLELASDVDVLLERLQALTSAHVLELSLSGQLNLADQARVDEGLAVAAARVRALDYELGHLHLHPTEADIAALQVDGYLIDVLQALQAMQKGGPEPRHSESAESLEQAAAAHDALIMLAAILHEART